ncbi:hypothetical protein THRCLA_23445, partial [Thraustotheca clavata]
MSQLLALHTHLISIAWLCCLPPIQAQTGYTTGKADKRVEALNLTNSFSCAGGPTLCPDAGTFKWAGGNITVTVIEMRNLPNLDGFGRAAYLTDAYVRVSFGSNTLTSSYIPNNLNPIWTPCKTMGCLGNDEIVRDLTFGYRYSGEPFTLEVWDKDDGLEFGDDFIASMTLNVIYCSAYSSYTQRTPNPGFDSSFAMPLQPMCVEEVWLPLVPGTCVVNGTVSTTIPCVRLRQTVVPFQIRVEETYATVKTALMASGMGGYYPVTYSSVYGRVWTPGDQRLQPYYKMSKSQGGILLRMDNSPGMNNDKGNASLITKYGFAPLGRFSINFNAAMYVFRRQTDVNNDKMYGTLEWLQPKFGWVDAAESAQIVTIAEDFIGVTRNVSAIPVNTYGDALGSGIVIGSNIQQNNNDITLSMYFVVLVPFEGFFNITPVYSKAFSQYAFFLSTLQFGIAFCILLSMSVRYCRKMNFRLDRVQAFLAQIALELTPAEPGKKKKPPPIVAMLFLCYNDSKDNIEFRRHLYYSQIAVNVCVASPFFILLTWGITSVSTVQPPAVGFFLIYIGSGLMIGWYGLRKWIQMGWRMTREVLHCLCLACIFGFLFLFTSIFADPQVFLGGAQVDFFSLTAFFLTLNMMPMIWLIFTNDNKIMKSLAQVLAVVTVNKKVNVLKKKFKNLGAVGMKLVTASDAIRHDRGVKPVSPFDALLGGHYSIVRTIPGFEMADILQNAFVTQPDSQKKVNRRYYALAIAIVVVYTIIGYFRSAYPTQGIGILFTIIIIDSTMGLVLRGQLTWSAGYISLIIGLSRVSLAVSCGQFWLLGQTMAFVVFGSALCREIIGRNLPRMSAHEAGGITFFGHDINRDPLLDISATPEFGLGFLSFFFLFLLVGVAFTSTNTSVTLPILGQRWPLWVFGVLAFVIVIFSGIVLASSRAFFLMKQRLLSEYSAHMYLGKRNFKLPFVLAAASELLVVCCGLFLYAATNSSFIFLLLIFLPVLLMLSMVVLTQWRKNDHRLVIWPPEDEDDDLDDEAFDEEAEFAKEADAMRSAFVLPSLHSDTVTSSEFKMPPLPVLKGSALLGLGGGAASVLQLAGKSTLESNQKDKKNEEDEFEAAAKEDDDQKQSANPESPTMGEIIIFDTPSENTALTIATQQQATNKRKSFRQRILASLRCVKTIFSWKKYHDQAEDNAPVDFEKLTVYQAYKRGYLLEEDYLTIRCFIALLVGIFLFGFVASFTEAPPWIGQMIWVSCYILIFSVAPVFKWYHVLDVTYDIKRNIQFSYTLAWALGFAMFIVVLEMDVNNVQSLWILTLLVYYPLTLLFLVAFFKLRDDNWVLTNFVRTSFMACSGASTLFLFVMYIWASIPIGGAFTFLFATFGVIFYFMMKWVRNDYYLAPIYQRRANELVFGTAIFFVSLAILFGVNLFYCFSISIIILLLKLGINVLAIRICRVPDLQIFYSPYVFPIFSYNATTNNVNNENSEAHNIYSAMGVAFLWGCFGVMFTDPLGFGIGLCSIVLLSFVGFTAHLCSITP